MSEPTRRRPDAKVTEWLFARDSADLFISTVTPAEIWQGVHNLTVGHSRRREFLAWAAELSRLYRVLQFDERAARTWGELTAGVKRPLAVRDSFLAATALSRGLVLVSRNEADFAGTGVKLFNPWTT
jgi:predicted nucleic acid-binding protein